MNTAQNKTIDTRTCFLTSPVLTWIAIMYALCDFVANDILKRDLELYTRRGIIRRFDFQGRSQKLGNGIVVNSNCYISKAEKLYLSLNSLNNIFYQTNSRIMLPVTSKTSQHSRYCYLLGLLMIECILYIIRVQLAQ